ncbi:MULTISPECIES: capsid cement protein [unclassified Polaromonas]|jgi:hypothetical protein|uniref:capsid cement protein n=1 Tax=unclassified Polaromonas TaxID=2638319 RepID=UPI000BD4BCA2|nr:MULTISPECIES: capsid cement protein [unclassified Polaromonas]OYY34588.1 MAG: DUF2190 domain-containing protein [Polaromonas sp. 35-63-35]OYZ15077.1 MAG: DUF2190 domain-containing protein [Polaromonas sp. 16-63-31]OYZ78852.1 MAG: DUF2190 domain-containing protein [Polaromonas sp. 24-63-21]OZA49634.1 MAG: DUF2190 domain-containing protein [Polaromonas sp. 17-63-33]OZA86822.1 MAG: DUF2190 domain-containing protein [Polaromonas sp. 39-63-25]
MKTEQPILTTSIPATAALTARRFVTTVGAVPAAGAKVLGVANAGYDAGEQAGVGVLGIFLVEAGAAVAADANVETDVSGRAITLAAGVDCGRAMDAASAAGQFIRVVRGI